VPTGGDHGFRSLVDGLDDLGVVDTAEVSGCDCGIDVLDMRVIWQLCRGSRCGVRRSGISARVGYAVGV